MMRIVITGTDGCFQAWIHQDQWTAQRIGELFATYQEAEEAAKAAAKELEHKPK